MTDPRWVNKNQRVHLAAWPTQGAGRIVRSQGMAGKRKVVVKGLTSPKNKRRAQVAKKLAKQANAGVNGCTGMGSKPKR